MALQVIPFSAYRFRVSIENLAEGDRALGFSNVSGISEESDIIEYRTGEDGDTMRKYRGLTSIGDVTLERAKDDQGVMRQWRQEVFNADKHPFSAGNVPDAVAGRTSAPYKRTVTIQLLDAAGGSPIRTWTLINAWPTSLELGDLDASASELLVETVVLAHEGVQEAGFLAGGAVGPV